MGIQTGPIATLNLDQNIAYSYSRDFIIPVFISKEGRAKDTGFRLSPE